MEVQVGRADVRLDAGRRLSCEQAGHHAADDREMAPAEGATERPQDISGQARRRSHIGSW
jgi:hypothetical protein